MTADTTPTARTGREQLVGERTVPGLWHENYWFRRHEVAYAWLTGLLTRLVPRAGVVVEAGAGEGYGVDVLRAGGVERVVALDYDPGSLRHAVSVYPSARGRAARANLAHLPLAGDSAAAVVSLQVIEHLWTPWEFLADCARVLHPGGLLVVTTPNRPTFSPGLGRGEKPPNPYHVKEYDAEELRETVAGHLEVGQALGVRHGPRIAAWEAEHGGLVAAQLASPPPEWSPELTGLVTSITAGDFVVESMPDDDPRLLDLVLLATRGAG